MFRKPTSTHAQILSLGLCALAGAPSASQPNMPMMGWASWNKYGENITEATIKKQADAIVSSGLSAIGYDYVNIDDGFFNGRANDGTLLLNTTRFPNGFKPVVDYIHAKGLKAGFYSDAGANTCAQMYGSETGGKGAGLYGHDQQDIDLAFKTWGFDYIKVDYCGGRQTGLDEQTRYTAIGNALKATGRTDIQYNICRWQFPGGWITTVGSSWRIADDIGPWWSAVTRILDTSTYLPGFASKGHYNDMDMLEVGNGFTADQDRAHFALWCIHSSPLVLGNDMSNMNSTTLSILTNKEVLALNQDTSGLQAIKVSDDGNGDQVFVKRLNGLSGNERGVVMFNRSSSSKTMTVNWKDLDLEGAATVRDLWNKKDLGSFTGSYSFSVPATGCAALKIVGTTSKLQELFEAEYSFMNNFKWTKNVQIQANQATPILDAGCSRGAKVTKLGNSAANYAEFRNIWANAKSTYHATIYYLSATARSMTVTVNGRDTLLNGLNTGSATKRDSIRIPISLNAGTNTIRLSNSAGAMPDLDALRVDVNSVTSSIQATAPIRSNPAMDVLLSGERLEVRIEGQFLNASVHDMSGNLVAKSDRSSFAVGNLRPGTYLVQARTTEGSATRAFTKF
jgi:hypothetical protein